MTTDFCTLCWELAEVIKRETTRANLSPESRKTLTLARASLRNVPLLPELRVSAMFAVCRLYAYRDTLTDQQAQRCRDTIQLALQAIPDA